MRKKSALIALVILAFGLIGTALSTLYVQNEFLLHTVHFGDPSAEAWKFSYGFPLGWYGYSQQQVWSANPIPKFYWFSLGSLLLDAAFWVAISFFVSLAAIKSVNILRKTRASKISGTL
jgi:hypothetical protein